MKLTRASSYALHAVAFMAQQQTKRPVASHHIADARGIPERFLLKVLKPLVTARVLRSIKGPNGGYELARPADEISLLEILEAVDGPIRGLNPPFSVKDKSDEERAKIEKTNSNLNNRLDQLCDQSAKSIRKHLEQVRVADLLPGARKEEPAAPAPEPATATASKTASKRKPAKTKSAN